VNRPCDRIVGTAHARKERQASAVYLVKMRAGYVVGSAQLQDFDLTDRGQFVARVRKMDDAVGDGELGIACDFGGRVLADQQARRPPARRVHARS
jgi:hypothetical protein